MTGIIIITDNLIRDFSDGLLKGQEKNDVRSAISMDCKANRSFVRHCMAKRSRLTSENIALFSVGSIGVS